MQLLEFSSEMETNFKYWYDTINPEQQIKVNQFLLSYPLREITEDIFSAAEQNSIKIEITPTVAFNITVKNEKKELKCNYFPLESTRNGERTFTFCNNLKELFKNTKSDYADKKIVFYCLLPLTSYDISNDQFSFGIYGNFLIT